MESGADVSVSQTNVGLWEWEPAEKCEHFGFFVSILLPITKRRVSKWEGNKNYAPHFNTLPFIMSQ